MTTTAASAQVAPLAPRWLAGTPTPPVEAFTDSLARHHIDSTEPALIAALQSPDGDVRSLAAAQLAAMDDHQALPAISRALDNEHDPQVRVNLAGAATWLASRHALEQLELICQDVNSPSAVRLDAVRYVSNRESPACFPAIKEIERDSQDPAIRVQALLAAQCYRGQADRAAALAVSALADLDPSVRIAAADVLRLLHATNAVGPLNSALRVDGDDTAREHLREAIRVLNLPDPAH
jgi:HEAT repeat protein